MIRRIISLIIFITFIYVLIFGRALKQDENHLSILFHLPQVLITQKAVRIEDRKYLAMNNSSFIEKMNEEGFTFVEQMGAGYMFTKDEKKYISTSRIYSSYFMIFTEPYEYYISDLKLYLEQIQH